MTHDKTNPHARHARIETQLIHAHPADPATGAVSIPISQTATFKLPAPGDESGYVYSRSANPTRDTLESTLALLDGGARGLAFASGLAATNTLLNLLKSGDHVVAGDDLYGGTFRQFNRVHAPNSGIEFSYVDGRDPHNIARAITPKTKLVWIETPTNPLLKLYDISAIAEITRKRGILLAVDNTFATPWIQRPLDLGADVVIYSLTKYMAGHSDVVGGGLVVKNVDLGEKLAFYQNAVGGVLGPFDAWLILRGIKTLAVRLERQSQSAAKIARFLTTQGAVAEVFYPGLDGKTLPNNMRTGGGMLSFGIKAEFETVKRFVMATKFFTLAESLGGVESLVNHPASMTHASIPREERLVKGIDDGLVRLSVGIENVDDLIADLTSAFAVISSVAKSAVRV